MIREMLSQLDEIDAMLGVTKGEERRTLMERREELLIRCANLTAEQKVFLARHPRRPKIDAYIHELFTDFFEQKGDRQSREDPSVLGGIALLHGEPVTIIGHRKGTDLNENVAYNFGMPGAEGYRKAQRLMRQAEKFGRPVITFIDTPGAYPGMEAEEHGVGEAIAQCLALMSRLTVPTIAVVTGEGGSGGALALGVADRVLMLENAYYAVLTPEGFASILWKDASRRGEACEVMKLTAQDLHAYGVIDELITEPIGGAQRKPQAVFSALDEAIARHLAELKTMDIQTLRQTRYERFRQIGQ
ncbi:MAG: acetyl-CoA carboxylase carboxyltransferase subunit alpha [Clostridia bacterium]|nr:acetyl-CoA carboxylase carboxyltransferase subunit alpha [Clostridia bacterium]